MADSQSLARLPGEGRTLGVDCSAWLGGYRSGRRPSPVSAPIPRLVAPRPATFDQVPFLSHLGGEEIQEDADPGATA